MDSIIESIYKDYDYYRGRVGNIVGKDSLFIDDLISECIIKIHNKLKDGSIKAENISCNGSIKRYYFTTVITNYSFDHLKSKVNKIKFIELSDWMKAEDYVEDWHKKIPIKEIVGDVDTARISDDYDRVIGRLDELELKSLRWKHHVDVFKYYYIHGLSINELSKESGIGRTSLTSSKKIITQWLKEEENQVRV